MDRATYLQPVALSARQVAQLLGVSTSTIWRWRRDDPDFPKPKKLGGHTVRWQRSDIEAYFQDVSET